MVGDASWWMLGGLKMGCKFWRGRRGEVGLWLKANLEI